MEGRVCRLFPLNFTFEMKFSKKNLCRIFFPGLISPGKVEIGLPPKKYLETIPGPFKSFTIKKNNISEAVGEITPASFM